MGFLTICEEYTAFKYHFDSDYDTKYEYGDIVETEHGAYLCSRDMLHGNQFPIIVPFPKEGDMVTVRDKDFSGFASTLTIGK